MNYLIVSVSKLKFIVFSINFRDNFEDFLKKYQIILSLKKGKQKSFQSAPQYIFTGIWILSFEYFIGFFKFWWKFRDCFSHGFYGFEVESDYKKIQMVQRIRDGTANLKCSARKGSNPFKSSVFGPYFFLFFLFFFIQKNFRILLKVSWIYWFYPCCAQNSPNLLIFTCKFYRTTIITYSTLQNF